MNKTYENIGEVLKKTWLYLAITCLASSIIFVYLLPWTIEANLSKEEIQQELNSLEYMGATSISPQQIINSLVATFQSIEVSLAMIIAAYFVKQAIDKRLFDIKKWRDWRFLLYISGVSFILTYAFSIPGSQYNLAINLAITAICFLIIVSLSTRLLPSYLTSLQDKRHMQG